MKGRLLFKETQSFKHTWIWWIVIVSLMLLTAGIGKGILAQPDEDQLDVITLILVLTGSFLVIGFIVWLFQVMSLTVQIDQGTIMYRFYPFITQTRSIHKWDLKDVFVREYRPVRYGGNGYRLASFKGKKKVYTIIGKKALHLVFKNDKRLLLGTQKPDELEAAIHKLKENWNMN